MEFIISELKTEQSFEGMVVNKLKESLKDVEGLCFYQHPLTEAGESYFECSSFLILSPSIGIIIVDAFSYTTKEINDEVIKQILREGKNKKYKIYTKILENESLRDYMEKDERLRIDNILYYAFFPYIVKPDISNLSMGKNFPTQILLKNTFDESIREIKERYSVPLDEKIWNILVNEITGISKVIKKRIRIVDQSKKKAWIISEVEKQMQSLDIDQEQIKVGQQIPDGPQRIRGLAGTGKTIVLSMKAAYMHFKHPEWNIVYTFNTQSLYGYIEKLINKFYEYFSGGLKPDWERLRILHGWGGEQREGLYSFVSTLLGKRPKTFSEARSFIDHKKKIELLGKLCHELLNSQSIPEMFDAIIIDEAQDFHKGFYQFSYKLLKPPKRLIWAYDELQSLEDITIPTAKEIFGTDKNGNPIVDLDGVYPGGIEKDFILYKAYRNPRVVLMVAHFYGMGIFRKKGPIQFIPSKEAWEDLGYEVAGEWKTGEKVVIKRSEKNSPNLIEKYIGYQKVIKTKEFSQKEKEIEWVANNIKKNIEEGILPEEILVIGLNKKRLFDIFQKLKGNLSALGIHSIIVGTDVGRDIFKVPGHVTISTVFKAKGNEAQVVYILNFEESELEEQIIQSRNMAFTSMTRTKGWLNITGTGYIMKELIKELDTILKMYPEIELTVPDMSKIKRYLDNIEYEKRRKRIKQSEQRIREALKTIKKEKGADILSKETIKEMKEIIKEAEKS